MMKKTILSLCAAFLAAVFFGAAACTNGIADSTKGSNSGSVSDGDLSNNSDDNSGMGTSGGAETDTDIAEKPQDCSLEFWITQDVADVDFGGHYEVLDIFGGRQFYGTGYYPVSEDGEVPTKPEHCVTYLVTAWPDYADGGQYITRIEITDPSVTVYGLTCASSLEEFDEVFKGMGYTVTADMDTMHAAVSGKITFRLWTADGKGELSISAEVTNRDGIVF